MAVKNSKKFDKDLLKILACPKAIELNPENERAGKLDLFKDTWLISKESGYKYPIVEGVPILLMDVGKKWSKTKEKDLPVPPPNEYS